MIIKTIKKDFKQVFDEIKKNTPIIIYKKLLKPRQCKLIVSTCHKNFSSRMHRKKRPNKYFDFVSLDVLPSGVKSNRIFRTFELSKYFIEKFKFIKDIQNLQNKITKLEKKKKFIGRHK